MPEVAERISLSRTKTYHLISAGTIPSIKIGRARRVRESDLDDYIASLEQEVTA